jgi:copper resistance protein C
MVKLMRYLAPLALTVAGLIVASGTVFAHAHLESATPPVGGTVSVAPGEVSIEFSEAVEPHFSTIHVQDAAGQPVDTGDLRVSTTDPKRLVISLRPLQPGTYKVLWRVTSVDTHKTEGSYDFTVSP